jgi:hypothetical protein
MEWMKVWIDICKEHLYIANNLDWKKVWIDRCRNGDFYVTQREIDLAYCLKKGKPLAASCNQLSKGGGGGRRGWRLPSLSCHGGAQENPRLYQGTRSRRDRFLFRSGFFRRVS